MRNILFITLLFPAALVSYKTAYADSFPATMTGGTLQSNITMTVAVATCIVNNGQGFAQAVDMPSTSVSEVNSGTALTGEALLKVDCSQGAIQPDNIVLSVAPAGGSSIVGTSADGVIATNISGLGLKLTWPDGLPVSLDIAQPRVFPASSAVGGVWNTRIVAQPIKVTAEPFQGGGAYTGTVTVTLSYS